MSDKQQIKKLREYMVEKVNEICDSDSSSSEEICEINTVSQSNNNNNNNLSLLKKNIPVKGHLNRYFT